MSLHDQGAEVLFLGACLLDPTVIESTGASPEWMSSPPHRQALAAMVGLRHRAQPVDSVSLRTELERLGWDHVRAVQFVLPLTDRVPPDARTLAARLRLLADARAVSDAASMGLAHAQRLELSEAREKLSTVAFGANADEAEIVGATGLIRAAGEAWMDISQDRERELRGEEPRYITLRLGREGPTVQTLPGDCITVAGATGVGKSSMAMTTADELDNRRVATGIISVEDNLAKYGSKLLGARARVDTRGFWKGAASQQQWDAVERAGTMIHAGESKLRFAHVKSGAVDGVVRAMAQMVRVYGVRFLIVDYLQAIQPGDQKATRRDATDSVLARILSTARLLDVPVMMLSQLSRPEKGNPFREPQLQDLKESGTIENSSDAVVMLWITTDDKSDKSYGVVRAKLAKDKLDERGDRWAMRRGPGQVLEEIVGWVEPQGMGEL